MSRREHWRCSRTGACNINCFHILSTSHNFCNFYSLYHSTWCNVANTRFIFWNIIFSAVPPAMPVCGFRRVPSFQGSSRYPKALFFLWRYVPTLATASSFFRFLYHTQRRTTVGRTPLDGWSVRRRDLTTLDVHNIKTPMPPEGFEPTGLSGERPQTEVLDRVATGTGFYFIYFPQFYCHIHRCLLLAYFLGVCRKGASKTRKSPNIGCLGTSKPYTSVHPIIH
jgi:hypothetical protein